MEEAFMGMGYLQVNAFAAFHALPVEGAAVTVMGQNETTLYQLVTDAGGNTETVSLEAPELSHTMGPEDPGPYYACYNVSVEAEGFNPVYVQGVQVFDTETSILPVEMTPMSRTAIPQEIVIPENTLHAGQSHQQDKEGAEPSLARRAVFIPEEIIVHLGSPASSAQNDRVGFADYIKNVASSEIYPTWPEAALEANIYSQISFALNRIYTEWYPSRGYSFHITNSTAYDQSYVKGRNIFASISQIVDRIFNIYVRRMGYAEPYFTQYCNGTTVTCRGLSQWGTVPLAQRGLGAYQILRQYYPQDIQLVMTNLIEGVRESYPGAPLRQGSQGEEVRRMQNQLNRIRVNYPLIPEISNPNGIFGADTAAAARTFQQVFSLAVDGVVGKATWYKIISIYNGVTKLAELESEGERVGIGQNPPTSVLREGSRGGDVVQLQFILNFIAEFYSTIPTVLQNSLFDARTRQSVAAFQAQFGLTADGVVGPATWQALYRVYRDIEAAVEGPGSPGTPGTGGSTYPGVLLRNGSRGESVRQIQRYLNAIYNGCPGAPVLVEDGIFGNNTQSVVMSFQRQNDLAVDGIVGPLTWEAIVAAASI